MQHHRLIAEPETVHWGWFEAALPPVLTIESGDRVTVETVSGGPGNLPGEDFYVPPELYRIHEKCQRRLPGHILTGPIRIRGAEPGDVLEIRILDISLRQDWGYTFIRPLAGALPNDFDTGEQMIVALDRDRNMARLPWGTELPLRPFFGVMGVAPPPAWGSISSIQPRAHGGNLDNKELIPGATLYLPVLTEGGHLSLGDGHGVQGDGEVCTTAIETALEGTIEVILRKDLNFTYPHAETPTHYVTMGMDPDLDDAASHALRRMMELVTTNSNLSRHQAFMLMSLSADVRVTQLVNEHKGIHVMLPKSVLSQP
ncbi:acetamidase/formamidase family protein [Ferrovibrio sp.]|uniref:acetamidase/formamidase family protein n=1 Tax=Ferrovibrio sp. TaxID=1917215 RepID=UPI0025BD46E2|nr:acetamidase/formamidase family protein [Ferrovibrio sp.]MBX3454678.1 acetamidase/formamidase family protein [Ferrovibrio sp.]